MTCLCDSVTAPLRSRLRKVLDREREGAVVLSNEVTGTAHYPLIEARNSLLVRVLPSLSSSSSMVSTGESGLSTRRRI